MSRLGPDTPLHFTAFHPDWKMRDTPPTPAATLTRARAIGLKNGLRYVYTGNVHDRQGASTYCPRCSACVIERDWYDLGRRRIDSHGACAVCGERIAGVFGAAPSRAGRKRALVRLA